MGRDRTASPAPGATTAERLDAESVEGLRRLEETIGSVAYAHVCAIFLQNCSDEINALTATVAADDHAATRRLAHKLKGSMASLGAVRISRLAGDLEGVEVSADRQTLAAEIVSELGRLVLALGRSAASS